MSWLTNPGDWKKQVAFEQLLEVRATGCSIAAKAPSEQVTDEEEEEKCHGYCSDEDCHAVHDFDDDGEAFLGAAVDNDANKIRELITEKGIDAGYGNPAKQSALHLAALWGNGTSLIIAMTPHLNSEPT